MLLVSPSFVKLLNILRANFFALAAFFNNKHQRFARSIQNADKAISLYPDHCGAYWYKGTALYKLGKYNEALGVYMYAVDLMPGGKSFWRKPGFQIFNNIGICYIKMTQLEKAREYFDKAIAINSADYKAFGNKACLCSLQNQKEEAMENLSHAIALHPAYKKEARKDPDFANIRMLDEFQALTGFRL